MQFDFNKKCVMKGCSRKVWDGCSANLGCYQHCRCPDKQQVKNFEKLPIVVPEDKLIHHKNEN
jgi:hypothetical protein